jgi:hypothetical protein
MGFKELPQRHEAEAILLANSIFERSEASLDAEAGLANAVRILRCSLLEGLPTESLV